MEQQDSSYRSAVLHHWVLHLVTLGDAAREEAALANVIVEMLQTSIPVGIRRTVKNGNEKRADGGRESIKGGEIYGSVLSAAAVVKILFFLNEKFILWPWDSSLKFITTLLMKGPTDNKAGTPLLTEPEI